MQVQEVLDPDDRETVRPAVALGNAPGPSREPRRVIDVVAPEVLFLAEDLGDSTRASRACGLAVTLIYRTGGTEALRTSEAAQWVERADRYAKPGTAERAVADAFLALLRFYNDRSEEGVAHAGKALELARRLDDPEAFWQAVHAWLFLAKAPQHGEEVLRLADELAIRPRTGVSAPRLTSTMCEIGSTFLAWGQRGRAEEVWREMDEVAQRTGNPTALLFSMLANAIFASLDGRLEDAVAMGQSMSNRGGELGMLWIR